MAGNNDNLIPPKKGEIRNPKGRGKGVPNSKTRMLRLLELTQDLTNPVTGIVEGFSVMEQIDMILIQKARKGDIHAIKEILDRLEGKAQQKVDMTLDGELNVALVKFVKGKDAADSKTDGS